MVPSFSNDLMIKTLPYEFDLLSLHRAYPERYPYLIESVAKGNPNARYDILFCSINKVIRKDALADEAFLPRLKKEFNALCRKEGSQELPFTGGWFVFLAYELAQEIEPVLKLFDKNLETPVAYADRCPAAFIRDHVLRKIFWVCEDEYLSLTDQADADYKHAISVLPGQFTIPEFSEEAPDIYRSHVDKIKQYIYDGDVFQVNLSRKWETLLTEPVIGADLYSQLRNTNPSPFAGIARLGDSQIISSSPERLVCLRGNRIETRPIAGTRPRADSRSADQHLSDELLAHPKERAEHVMLIDLERNDLGRVAIPGTVSVNELMVLESYAHVHHIVSNIQAVLDADYAPVDLISAVFPGGTITGCPKVRCMEIIAELERAPRGAYTGSMGYLDRNGNMDLNILIRTMTLTSKTLSFRAGAGIVADSDAQAEVNETRAKAEGMLRSIKAG